MALITCPECGNSVSDKAPACPTCGMPLHLANSIPTPPVVNGFQTTNAIQPNLNQQVQQGSSPQSELRVISIKCPHCKLDISSKDIISKNWAKCPDCGIDIPIDGNGVAFDSNLILERLAKFECSKDYLHKLFMQHLMDNADYDVFDNLKLISQTRKYFWAHEFGKADERALFPMCSYGKQCFEKLTDGRQYMLRDEYEAYFNTGKTVNFNSEDIRDVQLIAKEQSASENGYEFSHFSEVGTYAPTPYYYCLPIIEEVVEYNGKQYTFLGTANGPQIKYNIDNFPSAELLGQKPNFTDKSPITIFIFCVIVVLVIIFAIIAFVENGFWLGLLCLIIFGVIGYFVGLIVCIPILAISAGLDALIRAGINRQRRKKFRDRWKDLQEHKRQAAKKNFRLDLTYEVPEFPIP